MTEAVKPLGRPASPESIAALKKMMQLIRKKPGIPSTELAAKLELTTLQTSRFARRLEAKGELRIEKLPTGLIYYPGDEEALESKVKARAEEAPKSKAKAKAKAQAEA